MSTPVIFASGAPRRKSLFASDGDDNSFGDIMPNFGRDLLNSFPATTRKAIPKESREVMLNPFGSSSSRGGLVALSRLGGLSDLDGADNDCGGCGLGRCPTCRIIRLNGGSGNTISPNVFKSLAGAHPSLRDPGMKRLIGAVRPSSDYLARAAKPSKVQKIQRPLLVLSLDGVLDSRLPRHLSGGYMDVLTRPYLRTFIDYVLSLQSPWAVCFYTSLDRELALTTLRQLNLPTGGPERDERDGVVGLFARDDMREGWDGGEIECKDLGVLWDELYKEENIRWGPENTVVITDFPGHMKLHPFSFVLAPRVDYVQEDDPSEDSFLLLMIAVLRDLESETNFAYHIKEIEYNKPEFWTSEKPSLVNERNAYLADAVAICASKRITIRALTGNKHT
ncbi:hypothetical protein JCM10908_005244 [Rhodotorula pacifica]|uniref:uncharacterized protein n=1 Tax=Rhodotorula pacifica TaxID=1495444 RepID=UPI0031700E5D